MQILKFQKDPPGSVVHNGAFHGDSHAIFSTSGYFLHGCLLHVYYLELLGINDKNEHLRQFAGIYSKNF
jgi:hypothetical protein